MPPGSGSRPASARADSTPPTRRRPATAGRRSTPTCAPPPRTARASCCWCTARPRGPPGRAVRAASIPPSGCPTPRTIGAFARAIAVRYSGHFRDPLHPGRMLPRVRYFQAWNEPNLPIFLLPQWGRTGNGPWQAVSPGIYRGMLNAFYRGVKSAAPSDVVLSAATAPYGDPPGTAGGRMAPVTFLEGLFCLSPRLWLRSAALTRPTSTRSTTTPTRITPTVPARLAERHQRARPGQDLAHPARRTAAHITYCRRARSRLWVSEIDWTSGHPDTPGDPGALPRARLLRALAPGREPYRSGTRCATRSSRRTATGTPASTTTTGRRSPRRRLTGSRSWRCAWSPRRVDALGARAARRARSRSRSSRATAGGGLRSCATTRGGIFYAVRKLGSATQWRAVGGGAVSPVWTIGAEPGAPGPGYAGSTS